MALTDQDTLSEIQSHLIEPRDSGATWPSGLWTAAEVLAYCNQRQYRFLKETALLYSQLPITVAASQTDIPLPDVWIATARVSWRGSDGLITDVPIDSVWTADHAIPGWEALLAPRPYVYTDVDTAGTLHARILPPPAEAGELSLLCVALTAVLDGTGEIWTVPYEFVPAIKWGVMADMLHKVGRAQDVRAAYCEQRWDEGVEAAKIMLRGWE